MSDTHTATAAQKRETIASREWIDANGNPLNTGDESKAVGLRYVHLPSAKKVKQDYNPETDAPPPGTAFDWVFSPNSPDMVMCAIFGGLTLAGNIVNTATKGEKGDPNINPIELIKARFEEIAGGTWADRATGVGGIRYDKEKLAAAIAQAKKEKDPAPYLAKMEHKVDAKSGAVVPNDTKGAISYGAFALRNAAVKAAYDALTGGGTDIGAL